MGGISAHNGGGPKSPVYEGEGTQRPWRHGASGCCRLWRQLLVRLSSSQYSGFFLVSLFFVGFLRKDDRRKKIDLPIFAHVLSLWCRRSLVLSSRGVRGLELSHKHTLSKTRRGRFVCPSRGGQ